MNHIIVKTHISLIRVGDTVMRDGLMKTVTNTNLKRGGFLGPTLWGDSYSAGYKPVELVQFTTDSGVNA